MTTFDNPFILLDLDPDEVDPSKIAAHIERKNKEWSGVSRQGGGKKAKFAKAALALLPRMKSLLVDRQLEGRSAEDKIREFASEAKQFKKERKAKQNLELNELIELASHKGYITPEQFASLKIDFEDSFSEADIMGRLKVPIQAAAEKKVDSIKPLESSEMDLIAEDLLILGKRDLFHFLAENAYALSNVELSKLAAEVRKSVKANANINALIDAAGRLAGRAAIIFDPKNEEKRKQYVKSLELKSLVFIDVSIAFVAENDSLSADNFELLTKKGMENGVARKEVEDYIESVAKKKKYQIFRPVSSHLDQLVHCRACKKLNAKSARYCKSCGDPLAINCPQCSKSMEASDRNCGVCGFAVGDMRLAMPYLERARKLAAQGAMSKVMDELSEADRFWPNHEDAIKLRSQISERESKAAQNLAKIHVLLKERKIHEAKRMAKEGGSDPRFIELTSSISKKLHSTSALIELIRHKVGVGDIKGALKSFSELECIAVDLPEISSVTKLLAPPPPISAKATAEDRLIVVEWKVAAATADLSYIVYRRNISAKEAEPKNSFPQPSGLLYADGSIEPGCVYEYSVKSVRAGIESLTGATTGHLLATAEPMNVHAVPGDSLVTVTWTPHANQVLTAVVIKEGSVPVSMGDGKRLANVTRDGVTATKLKNGSIYGFRIASVYHPGSAHELVTRGIAVSATPDTPLKPIDKLNLKQVNGQIEAAWEAPTRGVPAILHLKKGGSVKKGESFPSRDIEIHGTRMPIISTSHSSFDPPDTGLLQFVILIIDGEMALVGASETVMVESKKHKEILIHFSMSPPGWRDRGNYQLEISTHGNRVKLPKLLLVQKKGSPAMIATDGKLVMEVQPDLGDGDVSTHLIPISLLKQNEYINLFLADSSLSDRFRIMLPSFNSMKVSS